ncbi:MAG: FkbM family methyltransferase [Bacteroidota bacterium]
MKKAKRILNQIIAQSGYRLVRVKEVDDIYLAWLQQLQNSNNIDIVFDIGANEGQTIKHFRKLLPSSFIYAFEPSKSAFERLQANVTSDQNCYLFPIALGEHDGSSKLYENSSDVTNSLLPVSNKITDYTPAQMCTPIGDSEVQVSRIDSFCKENKIKKIDLLKIDAQGYENFILQGAGELLHPQFIKGILIEVLFVELYQNQSWFDEILKTLRLRNYKLFGLTDISKHKKVGWRWANALFIGDDQ